MKLRPLLFAQRPGSFLARIGRDTAGNTLAMLAAALIPLLAMIGGGIDLSRGYLAQSRLQQACDAGVLAARKRMGASVAANGKLPARARKAGERLFETNFTDGKYGTTGRGFEMKLETDYSVSGVATVIVPTTIMTLFGYTKIPLATECEARLNFSNTDIMLVLDVTGSMAEVNPGDSVQRIDAMKATAKSFHAQLTSSANPGTRLRFGFLPYSTNVNVGHLLADDWVNTDWKYNARKSKTVPGPVTSHTYDRDWTWKSGTRSANTLVSSYPATMHSASPGSSYVDENEQVVTVPPGGDYYTCDGATPTGNYTANTQILGTTTQPFAGPPEGEQKIEKRRLTENGTRYWTGRSGSTCNVYSRTYNAYVQEYERVTEPRQTLVAKYRYGLFKHDMSNWRTTTPGCIEERGTYEIADWSNVNLSRALDLDLDTVPNGNAKSKWSPLHPAVVYERSLNWDGTGSFTKAEVVSKKTFFHPGAAGLAPCPAPARALAAITTTELETYLGQLKPNGATYHDIGMIWGGRMLSPKGLYAAANADVDGKPTSRHLVFLTDGQTAPLDIAYSAYGVEPLDSRRWSPGSSLTLTQVVEKRFAFACNEVKKRNITVWVVGFGTSLNSVMTGCAGEGHYFEAANAEELQSVFTTIAKRMGDLRISK